MNNFKIKSLYELKQLIETITYREVDVISHSLSISKFFRTVTETKLNILRILLIKDYIPSEHNLLPLPEDKYLIPVIKDSEGKISMFDLNDPRLETPDVFDNLLIYTIDQYTTHLDHIRVTEKVASNMKPHSYNIQYVKPK